MKRLASWGALALVFAPLDRAVAHPGHGRSGTGQSLAHYLLEPIHFVGIAGLVVALVCLVLWVRARGRDAAQSRQDS